MNMRICAICAVVLVVLEPISGILSFNFFPGLVNPRAQNPQQGGQLRAMMGFQQCTPPWMAGNRGAAGAGQGAAGTPGGSARPGAGAAVGAGNRVGAGNPGAGPPGSPFMNPLLMGAWDMPDRPDMMGFGCFCSNECFGLGIMGPTDPVCSRYSMCCSCDGMMDFGMWK